MSCESNRRGECRGEARNQDQPQCGCCPSPAAVLPVLKVNIAHALAAGIDSNTISAILHSIISASRLRRASHQRRFFTKISVRASNSMERP
jgi:hypothetical protein